MAGGGAELGFFLKIFFLFSSDRKPENFFHRLRAKILFSGQSKNKNKIFFFLYSIMLEMYSFRFIRFFFFF